MPGEGSTPNEEVLVVSSDYGLGYLHIGLPNCKGSLIVLGGSYQLGDPGPKMTRSNNGFENNNLASCPILDFFGSDCLWTFHKAKTYAARHVESDLMRTQELCHIFPADICLHGSGCILRLGDNKTLRQRGTS